MKPKFPKVKREWGCLVQEHSATWLDFECALLSSAPAALSDTGARDKDSDTPRVENTLDDL